MECSACLAASFSKVRPTAQIPPQSDSTVAILSHLSPTVHSARRGATARSASTSLPHPQLAPTEFAAAVHQRLLAKSSTPSLAAVTFAHRAPFRIRRRDLSAAPVLWCGEKAHQIFTLSPPPNQATTLCTNQTTQNCTCPDAAVCRSCAHNVGRADVPPNGLSCPLKTCPFLSTQVPLFFRHLARHGCRTGLSHHRWSVLAEYQHENYRYFFFFWSQC